MIFRKLIVNADDFGLTEKVNQAIIESYQTGIVTSTSLLASGAAFESATGLARQHRGLGIGVHLNLTHGPPLSRALDDSPMVVDGVFALSVFQVAGKILARKVGHASLEIELRAQIEKVIASGLKISHLDGHKHIHLLPPIFDLTIKLAKEYQIPSIRCPLERSMGLMRSIRACTRKEFGPSKQYLLARTLSALAATQRRKLDRAGISHVAHFFGISQTGYLDANTLRDILKQLPEGVSELMCHPGFVDSSLAHTSTRLLRQRQIEFEALAHPTIRDLVDRQRIELVTYRELSDRPAMVRAAAAEEKVAPAWPRRFGVYKK